MDTHIEPTILFQDEHIVVISKPAGWVSMDADSVRAQTVQEWFSNWVVKNPSQVDWQGLLPESFTTQYGTPEEIYAQRGGVAHRLDKDTSGVMVLARHPASLLHLLKQFKERLVQKQYRCLVHGKFQVLSGEFTGPIGRSVVNRQKFAIMADGRPANTWYSVERYYPHFNLSALVEAVVEKPPRFLQSIKVYQGFSEVICRPKTGRTHQIRVHLADARHPLVGDIVYTGKKRAKLDGLWCPRQFLHAESIEFLHPVSKQQVLVEAPLPDDLKKVLGVFEEM